MRINKYIAHTGYTSRRKADKLIKQGRVSVNGQKVTEAGLDVKEGDLVTVDGKSLVLEDKVYYLLNKPVGYMSSLSDPNYDSFVVDLIDEEKRIYPVGRLDVDSHGLLLLTNDGDLTYKLTHPSKGIKKVYQVIVDKNLTKDDIRKFSTGIDIGDERLCKAEIEKISDKSYQVTILEGRNRQVRRMFKALGYKVLDLMREMEGPIELGDLKLGQYRKLEKEEIEALKNYV